ncbi:hypothetical protein QBC44DRAFT_404355 [Cladorrhinum sp. PSN332]|nr:hypothetical protein QBC44DRAFT_404355 [Cladorrhinum sp. PSN332]
MQSRSGLSLALALSAITVVSGQSGSFTPAQTTPVQASPTTNTQISTVTHVVCPVNLSWGDIRASVVTANQVSTEYLLACITDSTDECAYFNHQAFTLTAGPSTMRYTQSQDDNLRGQTTTWQCSSLGIDSAICTLTTIISNASTQKPTTYIQTSNLEAKIYSSYSRQLTITGGLEHLAAASTAAIASSSSSSAFTTTTARRSGAGTQVKWSPKLMLGVLGTAVVGLATLF